QATAPTTFGAAAGTSHRVNLDVADCWRPVGIEPPGVGQVDARALVIPHSHEGAIGSRGEAGINLVVGRALVDRELGAEFGTRCGKPLGADAKAAGVTNRVLPGSDVGAVREACDRGRALVPVGRRVRA